LKWALGDCQLVAAFKRQSSDVYGKDVAYGAPFPRSCASNGIAATSSAIGTGVARRR
jgi:hypothetical protein